MSVCVHCASNPLGKFSTLEDLTAPTNSPVFVQPHSCRRRWRHGHVIMSAPEAPLSGAAAAAPRESAANTAREDLRSSTRMLRMGRQRLGGRGYWGSRDGIATSTRSVNIDVQSRLLYTLAMRGEEAWGACWRSGTAAATPEWRGGSRPAVARPRLATGAAGMAHQTWRASRK